MRNKRHHKVTRFVGLYYWIRRNITMPLANKLIGCRKRYSIVIMRDGCYYMAEYHRQQFWYDTEKITIKRILEKRRTWHVMYWDKGEKLGFGGIEMCFNLGQPIFEGRKKDVHNLILKELERVTNHWISLRTNNEKEKENET